MASLIEELINVLNDECDIYEKLYDIALEKTPIIVAGNVDELQKITDIEQNTVDNILILEKRREIAVYDIAMVLNCNVKTLKIAEIIDLMESQPEVQLQLKTVHKRLKKVVNDLLEANHRNKNLIDNSLEMAEFSINLLQNTQIVPDTANYNRGAANVDTFAPTKALFDTKQ